jgi:Fe-S-cluster containining protein
MKMIEPEELVSRAKQAEAENKKFFNRLKTRKPKNLDQVVSGLHDQVFEKIDCLDCGNCCKTLGPRLNSIDIERISKYLGQKHDKFIEKYLRIDEDGDDVFKSMPCPFLGSDNYCTIYEKRPKACAEYPHTDRRKFHQVLDLTLKNTFTCPAVFEIVNRLKDSYS